MSEPADELAAKLLRRTRISEGKLEGQNPSSKIFNPYTEFPVGLLDTVRLT
jgi:hypothetical protein